jgi:hypothetical protein
MAAAKSFLKYYKAGKFNEWSPGIAAEVTGAYNVDHAGSITGFGQYDIHGIYFIITNIISMMLIKEVIHQIAPGGRYW